MQSAHLPEDQSGASSKSNEPFKFWCNRIDAVLGLLKFAIIIVAPFLAWWVMAENGSSWYYCLLVALLTFFIVPCVLDFALSPLALLFWLVDGRYPIGRNLRIGLFGVLLNLGFATVLFGIMWISPEIGDLIAPSLARARERDQETHQPALNATATEQREVVDVTGANDPAYKSLQPGDRFTYKGKIYTKR